MKFLKSIFEAQNKDITLKPLGFDGFGFAVSILFDGDQIGEIVYRKKKYLADVGYPEVMEFHIGFDDEYQGRGFFQKSILKFLEQIGGPIYFAHGRIVNPFVYKAINRLDPDVFDIYEVDTGMIIDLK